MLGGRTTNFVKFNDLDPLSRSQESNVYKTLKKHLLTKQKAQGTDIWPEARFDEWLPSLLK